MSEITCTHCGGDINAEVKFGLAGLVYQLHFECQDCHRAGDMTMGDGW